MMRWWVPGVGAALSLLVGSASCDSGHTEVSNSADPDASDGGPALDASTENGSVDAPDSQSGEAGMDGATCTVDVFADQQLGTVADDEVRGLLLVGQRLVAFGYEGGTLGLQSIEPGGSAAGFVSIRDLNGNEQRRFDFDSPGSDVVEAAAASASAGRLAIVGRTTGALAGANAGQFDTFVALLDEGPGSPIVAQGGDERPQHPRSIAWHGDSLFIAGFDDTYIPTNYVEAWEDAWVDRWTVAGDNLSSAWRFVFGTADPDLLSGLAVDANGTPYVSGTRISGLGAGPFVRAISPANGAEVWNHLVAPFGSDHAAVVLIDAAGDLLVIGSSHATFGAPAGGQDVFVLRMDPATGAVTGMTGAGSEAIDWATAATLDSAGNLYVAGETFGALAGAPPPADERDMFVMRFDASLKLTGKWQSGRDGNDSATGVAVDTCGRVWVSGWTEAAWSPGTHIGGRDGVLARATF